MMLLRLLLLIPLFAGSLRISAQQTQGSTQDINENTTDSDSDQSDRLSGDWKGLRSRLQNQGLTIAIAYRSELVGNINGGSALKATDVGEIFLGTEFKTDKLHWKGGLLRFLVTRRHGASLVDKAGLDLLLNAQELYGRGQVFRLTELSVQQSLIGGRIAFKVGRFGYQDFGSMDCDFTTLALCGPPPSYMTPGYWYISPVGVWAGWTKIGNRRSYVRAGLSEDNRNNNDLGFFISRSGAKGVLATGEAGLTPRLLGQERPGLFRVGGSYLTSCDPDIFLDRSGQPFGRTGAKPQNDCGQTNIWIEGQQQLTGSGSQEPISGKITRKHGLEGFFSYYHGDARTATLLSQNTLGVFYCGPFAARPKDQVAVGFASTRYNPRADQAALLNASGSEHRGREDVVETYYGFQVLKGLSLRTGLQYLPRPGGTSKRASVLGVNLRLDVNF